MLYGFVGVCDDRRLALIAADGRPRHFDPDLVGDLELHALLAEPRDLPVDAAVVMTLSLDLQAVEKLLHLLLLALASAAG